MSVGVVLKAVMTILRVRLFRRQSPYSFSAES
jgi:hypothetical protein